MNRKKPTLHELTEMMGKAVANRTKDIFIRDRKLFIRLESAVIKNELLMMRSNIIEKMNERAGSSIIDEIIITYIHPGSFPTKVEKQG